MSRLFLSFCFTFGDCRVPSTWTLVDHPCRLKSQALQGKANVRLCTHLPVGYSGHQGFFWCLSFIFEKSIIWTHLWTVWSDDNKINTCLENLGIHTHHTDFIHPMNRSKPQGFSPQWSFQVLTDLETTALQATVKFWLCTFRKMPSQAARLMHVGLTSSSIVMTNAGFLVRLWVW